MTLNYGQMVDFADKLSSKIMPVSKLFWMQANWLLEPYFRLKLIPQACHRVQW